MLRLNSVKNTNFGLDNKQKIIFDALQNYMLGHKDKSNVPGDNSSDRTYISAAAVLLVPW